MQGWTAFVLGHRRLVVLTWLLVAIAGGVLAPRTSEALSYSFALPGQPGYETNRAITRLTGGGGVNDPVVVVATAQDGGLAAGPRSQAFTAALHRVASAVPGTRLVTPAAAPVLSAPTGRTAVGLLYPPVVPGPDAYASALPRLQAAVDAVNDSGGVVGGRLTLTGTAVLAESSSGADRSVLVETLLGAAGALVVLVLVFASLLAAVPLLVAAVSILATFLCLFGLTRVLEVSFVVQFLVALIGLGVAIDYSLLIVMRWREERAVDGVGNEAAVRNAMATAGRSVVFSGVTVALSLAALVAIPLPFLRSIGLGGLLIPLASVAAATTLVPVLLATAGPRLLWPRRRAGDADSRLWRRIALAVVRRPRLTAAVSTLILLGLAWPVVGLHLGSPTLDTYSAGTPAGAAVAGLRDAGIPVGVVRPLEVLLPPGADDARVTDATERLGAVPGVAGVVSPVGPGWSTSAGRLLQVWTRADPASASGAGTVADVRRAAELSSAGPAARVGGSPAEDADFVTAVYGPAPWVVAVIVVLTFLLLARALRSLWLPLKALLLNVVSLAAAYGITVLIWQDGWGTQTLFGTSASGAITTWVPIAVFAFLFGLSMDYEVFILARMREAHDDGADTPSAAVTGIAHTGRLVTSAALILFLAFVVLSTVPAVEVRILATALALGIAIDAVLVRGLLAPALVVLLGDANWTLPRPLARALRVEPTQVPHAPGGDQPSRLVAREARDPASEGA